MPPPPIRPDSFDKVNFVIDSWTTGCDAPWYIYIETMKPAALTAFFALLEFGTGDVVRGIFRPKGLGRRTGKRRGKWAKRLPAFPEIGNTIGRNIGSATGATAYTRWRAGGRTLWRIDLAMQSALLLWLVADIAEDFVFNWTSLLYESYWCIPPLRGRFSYQNLPTPAKGAWVWWKEGYGTEDYETGPPFWGFLSGSTGDKGATIAATATFSPVPGYDPPANCAVKIVGKDSGVVYGLTTSDVPDADGTFRIPVAANIGPNTRFEVRSWHDTSWAYVGAGVVMGQEDF
jgi:hypothetical protein